jgi:hypothetical protein
MSRGLFYMLVFNCNVLLFVPGLEFWRAWRFASSCDHITPTCKDVSISDLNAVFLEHSTTYAGLIHAYWLFRVQIDLWLVWYKSVLVVSIFVQSIYQKYTVRSSCQNLLGMFSLLLMVPSQSFVHQGGDQTNQKNWPAMLGWKTENAFYPCFRW